MMVRTRGLIALVIVALTARLAGDDWPAARTTEAFSESRVWFVRVVPGKSLGDTVGFAGAPKGPYARAEFYKRAADRSYRLTTEITLDNPIAPVQFVVTDHGYLITIDNWHNRGYGQVLATYAPSGVRVASYALTDLFSSREIETFVHSMSSIQWHANTFYVRSNQRSVYLALNGEGTELIIASATGAWQQCEWRNKQHLCRDDNVKRNWRRFREVE